MCTYGDYNRTTESNSHLPKSQNGDDKFWVLYIYKCWDRISDLNWQLIETDQ